VGSCPGSLFAGQNGRVWGNQRGGLRGGFARRGRGRNLGVSRGGRGGAECAVKEKEGRGI
jgi:hypothetical protein